MNKYSNPDYNYIKDLPEEIKTIEDKLKTLNNDKEKYEKQIKSTHGLALPIEFDNYDIYTQYLSIRNFYWKGYISILYKDWRGKKLKNTCLSKGFVNILYDSLYLVVTISLIVAFAKSFIKVNSFWGAVKIFAFSYLLIEIFTLLLSLYYYIVRPSSINRYYIAKDLKKCKSEIKILSNELKMKENLLENYKISSLDPNKALAETRINKSNSLESMLEQTRKDILPKTSKYVQEKYNIVLDKCDTLIKMSKEDGRILTEISKIYNIYLNDINNILIKIGDENREDLLTMLDNFNSYLDRKINKFSKISKIVIDSEIDALSKAFLEEDS